ncbi:intracellular short-chain-length polyhydroxyalkanoate depolymerase [Alkaliphilus peptidifermentans]|uniref:Pimeloyl-ACP methyl ester carboxylesterase n=1 Tax=Alkaliphilus peptidifermentans DSM 18978 TaxID=1120976 RepID=A0A1G5ABX7_9FIRM|nr:alpha/beta hydrolase [Alkaliphilus peptidifermentans]SCX75377.1 Pimeloyl-ACP methyl ester carboxylesterase [Alkaliphilus peptidifermentans DSM 18978]
MLKRLSYGTIEVKGGDTLFYREAGEGEKTILLIHGNMSSSKHWEPIMDSLSEEHHLYAVDLRGMGKSTYNRPFNSLKELAEDVKELIDQKMLENLVVVGWSTGGGVAMELAILYPEIIERLVLISSVSYKGYPLYKKDENGQPIIGEVYNTKEEMAQDPIQVIPALNAIENKDYDLMRQIWDALIYVHKKPEEDDYKMFLNATFEQRNLVDIDWALANFNLEESIKSINIPVLALWGDSDLVVAKDMVEETVKAIGVNAGLEILKNSGHSPMVDCPELLAEKIINFIKE